MPTVAFRTLGCRLNQAETDLIADQLIDLGFEVVPESAQPDVIVVNTCTVTNQATSGSRQTVRRAVDTAPGALVVLAGCYAVAEPEQASSIPGVGIVATNDDKESLARLIAERIGAPAKPPLLQISRRPASASGRTRVNIRAQTGCDEWCTFCIIPTTRGPLKSFPHDELIAQARRKVGAGAKEIVLTGVHLGKYGWDSGSPDDALVALIEGMLDIEGLARLRLSSILCRHVTPRVLSLMKSEERICRFLHIPLQSGSDDVLRRMNRPYSSAEFLEKVDEVRKEIPSIALSTDVIVGFPSESDDDFSETMEVSERCGFMKMHVFRYSARPGTPSAGWGGHVDEQVKKERSRALIALGNRMRLSFHERQVGASREVFIEESFPDGRLAGHTDDFVHVRMVGSADLKDRLVRATILEAHQDAVDGRLDRTVGWDRADPRDLRVPR